MRRCPRLGVLRIERPAAAAHGTTGRPVELSRADGRPVSARRQPAGRRRRGRAAVSHRSPRRRPAARVRLVRPHRDRGRSRFAGRAWRPWPASNGVRLLERLRARYYRDLERRRCSRSSAHGRAAAVGPVRDQDAGSCLVDVTPLKMCAAARGAWAAATWSSRRCVDGRGAARPTARSPSPSRRSAAGRPGRARDDPWPTAADSGARPGPRAASCRDRTARRAGLVRHAICVLAQTDGTASWPAGWTAPGSWSTCRSDVDARLAD